jgi:hypothetical protein
MDNKRLTNFSIPIEYYDAITKGCLKDNVLSLNSHYKYIDARNNWTKNIGDLVEETDAINKKYLNTENYEHVVPPNDLTWLDFLNEFTFVSHNSP